MKFNHSLPTDVVYCNECVISNQRPSSTVEFKQSFGEKKETIGISQDGVCEACSYNKIKNVEINWEAREEALTDLLDKHRKPSGYDVIVPGSGGKDSAFTAHILKYKYGMNPLTVTWAPHLYTQIGWENFQNWMHVGGLDNLLFTPNGRLHRFLTKIAFNNLLHPFQPFIVGQRIIGPSMAAKFGVPLVMYGENQAEYGNSIKENDQSRMNSKFYSNNDTKSLRLGGVEISDILKSQNFRINDFQPYLPLSNNVVEKSRIEVHYLGYFIKWDPQECFYYASENTGFVPNEERTQGSYSKYSSIDDKIDPFHYFTTLIKFGIGRATYDAAQEIRNGKITREEGIALVKKYDQEFPDRYFEEFLEYISEDVTSFWKTVNNARPSHLWHRSQDNWELTKPIWLK
jgi:N-acetyl sugar amidotransferase